MGDRAPDREGPPQGSDDPLHRVLDYEQTVGMIKTLIEVRFKLAALVPIVTGAAVGLIRANEIEASTRAVLGLGGVAVVLGIVVFDLRNSQIYNGAIGRARVLENELFGRYASDAHIGLFGSRSDSRAAHEARGTSRFLGMRVSDGTSLTLLYTATLLSWVWVLLDAAAKGARTATAEWNSGFGRWVHESPTWMAATLTAIVGIVFVHEYGTHNRGGRRKP